MILVIAENIYLKRFCIINILEMEIFIMKYFRILVLMSIMFENVIFYLEFKEIISLLKLLIIHIFK
jgi:hypothetical protein